MNMYSCATSLTFCHKAKYDMWYLFNLKAKTIE